MEFSTGKLILLLVIILVLFGARKLPSIGHDLGTAIRNFKKAKQDAESTEIAKSDDKKD